MQKTRLESGRRNRPPARNCRLTSALLTAACCSLLAWTAHAVEIPSLYTVEVPFDPGQSTAQTDAYRAALAEVVVRVTGITAADDAADLATLFPNPTRFVQQYQQGAEDTLIVTLDGDAIERVLRQANLPVWGADRPLTLVWLAVDWGMGEREIVAADDVGGLSGDPQSIDRNKLLRERVQDVAARRGIPVAFPLLDTEDLQNVSFSDIWGGFDERLLAASARYQAASVLIGRVRADNGQPNRWSWFFGAEGRQEWTSQPEEAISILADSLASTLRINPNQSVDTILLTISGIDSVVAYGRVQKMMENLRVFDKLQINAVSGDTISYEVEVQGGAERLRKALAASGLLDAVRSPGRIDARALGRSSGNTDTGLRMPGDSRVLEYQYRSRDD